MKITPTEDFTIISSTYKKQVKAKPKREKIYRNNARKVTKKKPTGPKS